VKNIYLVLFIIYCTQISAQEELKYQDYWYRYYPDSISVEF